MKKIFATIAILGLCSSGAAVAESVTVGSESSQRQNTCAAGMARLTNVKGGVLLSRGGSFSELRDGAQLSPGDRILVRDGSANVALGETVAFRAGAGTMVTIAEKDGVVCAKRVSSHPATVGQAESFDATPFVVGGAAAIVAGVGVGVGVSNTGNSDKQQHNAALLAGLLNTGNNIDPQQRDAALVYFLEQRRNAALLLLQSLSN